MITSTCISIYLCYLDTSLKVADSENLNIDILLPASAQKVAHSKN